MKKDELGAGAESRLAIYFEVGNNTNSKTKVEGGQMGQDIG